jgi:hypothetical protein
MNPILNSFLSKIPKTNEAFLFECFFEGKYKRLLARPESQAVGHYQVSYTGRWSIYDYDTNTWLEALVDER